MVAPVHISPNAPSWVHPPYNRQLRTRRLFVSKFSHKSPSKRRADMVAPAHISPNAPSWVHPPYKQRPPLWGWVVDERCSIFTVKAPAAPLPKLAPARVKLSEDGGAQGDATMAAAGQDSGKLSVQVGNLHGVNRFQDRSGLHEEGKGGGHN